MKFIELTLQIDGRKVMVNFKNVRQFIQDPEGGSVIVFGGEYDYFVVTETYDEIVELLNL